MANIAFQPTSDSFCLPHHLLTGGGQVQPDGAAVVGVANAKGSGLGALTQHGGVPLDDVLLYKHLATPLLNAGVHAQPLAIGGGADKAGVDPLTAGYR